MNRQQRDQLATAMENGWVLCPHMAHGAYSYGRPHNPEACCSLGHAKLGAAGSIRTDLFELFPFLLINSKNIKESHIVGEQFPFPKDVFDDILVFNAIIKLNDIYGWSTLEIASWLRSLQLTE